MTREADIVEQDELTQSMTGLGSGGQGTVLLDNQSMLVHKRFDSMDGAHAGDIARWEFEYLTRFHKALAGEPLLSCPVPHRFDYNSGTLQMSHFPGIRLDELLASDDEVIAGRLDQIAGQITRATDLYVREFDEPYLDLGLHNMLYDSESGELCFIDLTTLGDVRQFLQPWHGPVSFSLGNFIGTSVYHTVRPATWNNREYWQRVEELAVGVLSGLSKRHTISTEHVRDIGIRVYRVWALYGSPARRLWYETAGRALFRKRLGRLISQSPGIRE